MKDDCIRQLVTAYFGQDTRMYRARVQEQLGLYEFITRINGGGVIHCLLVDDMPQTIGDEAPLGEIIGYARAFKISHGKESTMSDDFLRIYQSTLVDEFPIEPSDDVKLRCADVEIRMQDHSPVMGHVLYKSDASNDNIYVQSLQRGGRSHSVVTGGELGLVREGNLLQLINTKRVVIVVFDSVGAISAAQAHPPSPEAAPVSGM